MKKSSNKEIIKKIDYELLFVQMICMFAVINGHYDCIETLISRFFPYYSWHMPFFIFISGIFFARTASKRSLLQFTQHKCNTLLFPALIINFCYGIISWFMRRYQIIYYGEDINFKNLFITPFRTNQQFENDISLWFIFQLFVIEMIANFVYRIPASFKAKTNVKDLLILLISFVISCYSMQSCMSIPNKTPEQIFFLRTGFLFFFFSMGVIYEEHIKCFFKSMKYPIIGCFAAFCLQMLLRIRIDNKHMIMYIREMNPLSIPHYLLPYITFATTSILLLSFTRCISPLIQNNRFLDFIGFDLHYIVYHHQFCAILIGMTALLIYAAGKKDLVPQFNPVSYRIHPFYICYSKPDYVVRPLSLAILFFAPLCVAKLINKNKNRWIRFLIWIMLFFIISAIIIITGRHFQDGLRNIR